MLIPKNIVENAPMARPTLSAVNMPVLPKGAGNFNDGTVSGTNIGISDLVTIKTHDGQKEWEGLVRGLVDGTNDSWNVRVGNIKYGASEDPTSTPGTVTVTVSNTDGISASLDTTSQIP
jgi:hypothetical protein